MAHDGIHELVRRANGTESTFDPMADSNVEHAVRATGPARSTPDVAITRVLIEGLAS